MRNKILAMALAGLALPTLALAAQPMLIRVEGRTVPLREVVQVMHTAAGPVRVRTWSWRGPTGAATFQVTESRGASAAVPTWALEQMRAMQAQMQQMRLIEAALVQPALMQSLPIPALFGEPLLAPFGMPQIAVRYLPPGVRLRVAPMPMRVIVILPRAAGAHAPAPVRRHGRMV